jgi:hypothetical protein
MSIDLGHTIATPLGNKRNLKKTQKETLNNKLTPPKKLTCILLGRQWHEEKEGKQYKKKKTNKRNMKK